MAKIENSPHQALIEEKVAEIPTSYCIECDGRGDNVWVGTSGEPEQIPCNYCHGQGEITTLDRVKRTLQATIDTVLEKQRRELLPFMQHDLQCATEFEAGDCDCGLKEALTPNK